jgi:hypothetical protein
MVLEKIGANGFAKLTTPSNLAIWIRASSVSSLRPPVSTEAPAGAVLIVGQGAIYQRVKEDVAAAKLLLNSRGANLL